MWRCGSTRDLIFSPLLYQLSYLGFIRKINMLRKTVFAVRLVIGSFSFWLPTEVSQKSPRVTAPRTNGERSRIGQWRSNLAISAGVASLSWRAAGAWN